MFWASLLGKMLASVGLADRCDKTFGLSRAGALAPFSNRQDGTIVFGRIHDKDIYHSRY